MKDDFYFDNENAENIPPVSFEKDQKEIDVEIDFSEQKTGEKTETEVEDVNNVDNVINSQNSTDNAEFSQNQPVSQPNYYGYQHSYQPFYSAQYHITEQTRLHCEKIEVKRTANIIGIGLLLFFALNFVCAFLLSLLTTTKEAAEFINNPAVVLERNIVITVLSFGLSAIFILKAQMAKASSLISYGLPKKGFLLPAILAAVGFCFTANIAVSLLQSKFQNVLPFASPNIEMPKGALGFVITVLAIAVTPALIEEFLFRGAIMGSLLKYGKGFAIFTSAAIFALVHGNLVQIPFAFLVGLVIGTMVIETDSIWTGVIIHFINNFISVSMDYLKGIANQDFLVLFELFLFAILIIIGIFATYVLSQKNKNLFDYEKPDQLSTSVQKFGWLSSSISIIFFFILVVLEILSTQFLSGKI